MKVDLVILTFNEIVGVVSVIPKISSLGLNKVFCVDGGSTDGTIEFLEKQGIEVYVQDKRGRGEAFRLAYEKSEADALIFFSPDGNEDPTDIPKFIDYLKEGYDIVIGTRMIQGARNEEDDQLFKLRKWVNNAFTLIANVLWNRSGQYITDSINGFRAIKRSAWDIIRPDGSGYTIEYQSTIRAFKNNLLIKEFPTIEGNRIDNKQGSPSFKTGVEFLKVLFREMVR